ncbi:hypothetical protein V2G26_016224 [Clonostachys chloroleuca]
MSAVVETVALVCLIWSCLVVLVESLGIRAIFKHYAKEPSPGVSPGLGQDAPSITIIRPVKGLEPKLYECIASTFRQDYPREKLSIRLCVDEYSDPAYPVLKQVVNDFPGFDAEVFVESDTASTDYMGKVGPNPKIRNISRAYREAKGEVIWIMDCNVWAAPGVLGRMIDKLMGYSKGGVSARPYKFVHQLPIVVDLVDYSGERSPAEQALLSPEASSSSVDPMPSRENDGLFTKIRLNGGGRLDELFMATTHAKFYGAINIVGVAPCVVGKSNMFRKAHLDQATDPTQNPILPKNQGRLTGVDYFSHNICEDHSIGELLWNTKIEGHGKHGIVWGDLVVQPMSGMSIDAYIGRRIRWLRARKYTVLAATLVEPGVESLLCGLYFSFGATTVPWVHEVFGIPQTWSAMAIAWLAFVTAWMLADWAVVRRLHAGSSITFDENTPFFAKGRRIPGVTNRRFLEWLPAWIGREVMAMPIWITAVLLGGTVNWRGRIFKVHSDTTVHEITPQVHQRPSQPRTPELERQMLPNKDRRD